MVVEHLEVLEVVTYSLIVHKMFRTFFTKQFGNFIKENCLLTLIF
jgi:hypothetical protein